MRGGMKNNLKTGAAFLLLIVLCTLGFIGCAEPKQADDVTDNIAQIKPNAAVSYLGPEGTYHLSCVI